MNAAEYANQLGVADSTVLREIRRGRIGAQWVPSIGRGNARGQWIIAAPMTVPANGVSAKRFAFLRRQPVTTVQWRCRHGKIQGAVKVGDCWRIPIDAHEQRGVT